jgi:hypothetical protein
MKLGKLSFLSLYLSAGILLLIISGGILPFRANAASPDSILVNIVPANPAPAENTTITLSSYANNLDSVLITWSVGGKSALSGIGKKTFSVNAPVAGSTTTVTATVALPDGNIVKTIIIRPAMMVLLWQADDSYVPPFYKGKALPTPDSEVKVVAMPEIRTGLQMVNPNNMTYAWKQDFTNNPDGSGYGKNFFIYTNDFLDNSNNIDVTASTIDQNFSSEANINIGTFQPKIDFYKDDPNFGTIWEQALADGHTIVDKEIIQAAPYFISPNDVRIPTLTWSWSINDSQVNIAGFRQNLIPLAVQTGTSGTSKIRLDINSADKIFETASKEINVNF